MIDRKIASVNRNVFFTGLVSLFMDISSEMVYPLVPIFLSSVLGVNKSLIGVIEGIAESTASLLRVFSGWLSDRIRRRKALMVAGYAISTLSRPILSLSTLWTHVLAFRFIDRFGKGIRVAPRDALIAESTSSSELGRSFGLHRAMDTLGAVLGPLLAFTILSVFRGNYRLVFWASLIPGVIAVAIIIFFIKERVQGFSPRRVACGDKGSSDKADIKNPNTQTPVSFDWRFKAFVAIATIFSLGNSSDVFLILRATDIGISVTTVPLLYLFFNLLYSLTSMPAGIVSDIAGRRRVIITGFLLFAFIYSGFALSSEVWHIWILFLLYGVFMGLTEGIQRAYLGSIIPEGLIATGYGIHSTLTGIALLPASIIGGYLWDRFGPQATFYYGSFTAFTSTVLLLIMMMVERKRG
jgi:MFS family permease